MFYYEDVAKLAVVEDIRGGYTNHTAWVIVGLVLINLVVQLLMKMMFWVIIAGVVALALGGVGIAILEEVGTMIVGAVLYLSGLLGPVIVIALIIGGIFAAYGVSTW